jgi:hypothetical protein
MGTNVYTWRVRQDIEICSDCLHVSASGAPDYEGYAASGHAERYAEGLARWSDEPCSTDSAGSFSRQACDYCGDTDAGDRFSASVMELRSEG